jgi:hypothetical protein
MIHIHMMQGVMYRPVLPDDSVVIDLGSDAQKPIECEQFDGFSHRPRKHQHHRSENTKKSKPSTPVQQSEDTKRPIVKLSNNKVLTIGLLVIVVILIIGIVIQIFRHGRSHEKSENNISSDYTTKDDCSNTQRFDPPPKLQQQPPKSEVVADSMLREYMRKKPVKLKERESAMTSHAHGRSADDDDAHMKTILEESETLEDSEYSQMRDNINNLLHEQSVDGEDDAMGTGSLQIIQSEYAVRSAQSKYSNLNQPKVADEALIEQIYPNDEHENTYSMSGDSVIDINADADDDDDDDDDDEPVGVCTFILVSGKRSGQQCGRKCGDVKSRCIRHKDK